MTTGQFLAEKMMNMSIWLEKERAFTALEATLLATELHDRKKAAITERSWDALLRDVPLPLKLIAQSVREDPSKHDKFWRYMDLFVTTISSTVV